MMIPKLKLLDERLDMVLLSSAALVASTKRKRWVIEICKGSDVYVFDVKDAKKEFGSIVLDAIDHDLKSTIVYGLETCTFISKPVYKYEIDYKTNNNKRKYANINATTVCKADDNSPIVILPLTTS